MRVTGRRGVSTIGVLLLAMPAAGCGDDDARGPANPSSMAAVTVVASSAPATTTARTEPARSVATSTPVGAATSTPVGAAPSGPTAPVAPAGSEVREGSNPCQADALPAVAAFDVASGDLTWTVCSPTEAYRTVLGATADAAYVAESVETGTDLVAHDVVDGREMWRRPLATGPTPGGGWPKGPIAGGGIIVVADGPPDAPLVGLDAATGAPRWQVDQATVTASTTEPTVPVITMTAMPSRRWSPIAGTEHVVVLLSTFGELAGLDRLSGEQRWDLPSLGGRDESGDVAGLAAAAVSGDRVVVPAGSETVAIDASTGNELWRAPRLDDPWADDAHVVGVQPPLTPSRPPSELAAVDVATGAPASVVPGRESYGDRLAVGDGGVFVLDPDDGAAIVGYDLASGAVRWTSAAGRALGEPQSVLDDLVLTLWEGSLAALSTDDGTVRWAWHQPVGSDWMNALGTNATTVFVAVNSLPFGD